MNAFSSVVIAIPHGAISIPEGIRRGFQSHVTDEFLRSQSDVFTDQVYALPGVTCVHAKWHRFVADPNRSPFDGRALGVVPTVGFDGRDLYREGHRPGTEGFQQRLSDYHEPYQRSVAEAVEDARIFIDGHSMAEVGPASSLDCARSRPQACVGNCGDVNGDPFPEDVITCAPEDLLWAGARLAEHLSATLPGAEPVEVGINQPFRGGYGIRRHAAPGTGRVGLQVELNQGLWWSESEGLNTDQMQRVRRALGGWVLDLSGYCWKQ